VNRVYIIAEAGVNHNGSLEIALQLIDAAFETGADAVKFQTFKAENLLVRSTPKADYQKETTDPDESQFDMIKKLELDYNAHKALIDYCSRKEICFISSPFDCESVDLLYDLGVSMIKIPSGEITNLPYLRKIGSLGKQVILSTGMADLGEIEDALGILCESGTSLEDITVLHCTSQYPAKFEEVNLRAMLTIRDAFNVKTGYSDHTEGIEIPIAAATLGAEVIEKHFTLDKSLPGPDHRASLDPDEMKEMVRAIRNVEKALGDGIKKPTESEMKNRSFIRKSIVSSMAINKYEEYTTENLTVKRPAGGLSPMNWDLIIGKKAMRNYSYNEFIE